MIANINSLHLKKHSWESIKMKLNSNMYQIINVNIG